MRVKPKASPMLGVVLLPFFLIGAARALSAAQMAASAARQPTHDGATLTGYLSMRERLLKGQKREAMKLWVELAERPLRIPDDLTGSGTLADVTPAVAMLHVGETLRDEARAAEARGDFRGAATWQARLETLSLRLKEAPGQSDIGQNLARRLHQLARR